jgi:hypothetical protein
MRSGRCFSSLLLGLVIVAAACRLSISADGVDKPDAATVDKPNQPVAPPGASLDLSQLPVGKTIGLVEGDARVLKALEEPAEFALTDVQLGTFVQQITEKHKISVKLDVAALTADGKGPETILNGKTTGTSLRSALRLFLDEQGLTFVVRNDTLQVTTRKAAEVLTATRLYQVHDLIYKPNDPYLRPDFESLVELLSSTIQPESWRENGGTAGEVKSFRGPGIAVLVVQHTEEGHEQVEKLLADLRAAKTPELLELQKKSLIPPPQPGPGGTGPVIGSPIPVVGQGQGMGAGF